MTDSYQIIIILLALIAGVFLFVAIMALLRGYFLWLLGTGRIIEQNDEMIKLLKYIAANKQPPTA